MTDEGNISGLLVQTHEQLLAKRLGPEAYRRYREKLTPTDRAAIEGAEPLTWVPIGTADRMFSVAAEVTGQEKWALHDEVVAEASEQAVKLLWRMLLSMVSDELLFSRASIIVRKAYDRGAASGRVVAPGHGEVAVTGWPGIPDRAFHGLRVSTASVLRVARRKEITVTARRTPDGALYEVRWKV